jgi:hypothetical protein
MAMRANRFSAKPMNGRHTPDHRGTEGGSVPDNTDGREEQEKTTPDELKLLVKQFRELSEYFSYFVTAKTDSAKLSVRQFVLRVVLITFGFVAIAGLIVIASWLILSGVAGGLSGLFGNRPWAGSFTTGILILGGLWLGTYYSMAKRNKLARDRTAKKYERVISHEK